MAYQIRWKDPVLWPGVLRAVPTGFRVVTDPRSAHSLIEPEIVKVGLPPVRAAAFAALWHANLDRGLLPSGLLLLRQGGLVDALGHTSTGTVRRWAQFCTRRGLWLHVPGKLHPPLQPGSGRRTRAYVLLQPSDPGLPPDGVD